MSSLKAIRLMMLLGTVSFAALAHAQETPVAANDTNSLGLLEEIVVTAQKREQTLQDVPVAVAVMDDSFLREQHINSLETLNSAVPNLVVTRSPFQPFVAIRGLGSGGGGRAFEQSVATYVDGIYAGRANQFMNPFFDVERLEVVRGPQSVLFGVNANAGAINIVNKRPGANFEGYATAGYEFENQGYNAESAVSVPLSDTLGVRLAGKATRDGGYVRDTVSGKDQGRADSRIVRILTSWQPTEAFTADLSYENGHRKINGTTLQLTSLGSVPFPPNVEDGKFDFRKSSSGGPEFTRLDTDNATLNLSYDTGSAIISSSSGYSSYDFAQALPGGNHAIPVGTAIDDETFEQFYQEMRLVSAERRFIDYIVGATYYHQQSEINQGVDMDFTGFGVPGLRAGIRNGLDQTTDGYSAFGQATVNFTDAFNVVLGGRYSSITKKADYVIAPTSAGQPATGYNFDPASLFVLNGAPLSFFQWFNPANPATFRSSRFNRKRTDDAFNPAISLNYKFSPDLSGYASFTTGTKAGGFNDQEKSGLVPEEGSSRDFFEYNKEKARNFELGLKADTGHVRANIATFYTKYSDLQATQVLSGGSLLTANAASATAKGVEVDLTWLIARGLTLSADAAYLHARYDDYPGACAVGDLNCSDPTTGNAKGGRLEGVPDFTGSINLAYFVPVTDTLELQTRGRVYYNDGAQFGSNQNPLDRVPSYTFLDASIGVAQMDGGYSITLSGKNLTNKAARGFSGPSVADALYGHYSATLPGRQIFLDVRYEF